MACYPLAHHDIADSTTRDPRPQRVQPHFMQNNSYLAKKCDAVDRILNCGFDLVYVTVNAMVYLTLYNKNYTNSALGFRGSSPTATDPQAVVNSFAPWYNVLVVLRCCTVLTKRLSGKETTNSSVITVESDSSSASLLPSNADLNTSVTMRNDPSVVVIVCCLLL